MRAETKARSAPRPAEIQPEEEVELGRYWGALAARWWLPLAGLLAGLVIGYLIAAGSSNVYKAQATIYLGQPLSAAGTQIQGPSTNPAAVRQVVFSRWAQARAERAAGMRAGALSGHVSTQAVQGGPPPPGGPRPNPPLNN